MKMNWSLPDWLTHASLDAYTSFSQPPGRGPVPGPGINYTGPREVLPEFVIFCFLSNFFEYMFYSGNILRRKSVEKLRPSCWPEETTICYKISLVHWLITNLNVILYLSTCHIVYISELIFFMIIPKLIINTYVRLMYELKKMERYLRVNLLGPCPRLTKKEFTGPRSHKGWETLTYTICLMT